MPPKRRHISIDESSEENHVPKRRRTNDYPNHNGHNIRINTQGADDEESSSDYDLSRVSEEKSYNSEPDYPDEESRSESTRRGGSYDEESDDDPDNEPTIVDLVEDPDLPSPDPRIAATRPRPRPRYIGHNNNGSRHFSSPRALPGALIHIDDEEQMSALFSPRSARAAQALLSEEEKARLKREEDERKSERLARQLLEQELELNDHYVRIRPRVSAPSPQPSTNMTDEEYARMLQEQEEQMMHNEYSGYSRRLFTAPRIVSPVHDDYNYLNLNAQSPSISFSRRLHNHHGHRHHHHHSPVGHMSYESLVNLEPVKVAAKNIHLLPVSVYNKENVKNSAQSSCSICLDDFETGDKVKTLPCFHAFHAACVDKWLKMNHVCPVCKKEVDTE